MVRPVERNGRRFPGAVEKQGVNKVLRIGISRCLLGERVRYDGRDKRCPPLSALADVEWIPFCPEWECGLPVPREPMNLEFLSGEIRLIARDSRRDLTGLLIQWIGGTLHGERFLHMDGVILKSRSPSCGLHLPKPAGAGLWARALQERFPGLPCIEETEAAAPEKLEAFLQNCRRRRKA